jgi:hypothetical protein
MTKLIVTPIDMSAKGSWALRKRLFGAFTAMKDAEAGQNGIEIMAAYTTIEDMILDRLETDDGMPVADALDEISAEQFDQLIGGLLGTPTIPPAKSTP